MQRLLRLFITNPLAIFLLAYYWLLMLIYKARGIKTVVYNLHHDYFYDIFYPIYQALRKRTDIVVYFSYLHKNEALHKYLSSRLENKRMISSRISPFVPFDLFICAEITGPDFPFSLLKTRTLEIYHGNGIAGFVEKKDVLNRFDAHFAIGPVFNEFIEFAYQDKPFKPRVYNVGYPKLDILLQQDELTEKLRQQYKLKDRPTILYAPHWNPYGSLHKFDLKLIEIMAAFDINLLVKPHHYLYVKFARDNWQQKLHIAEEKFENMTLIHRPNTQELYPLADLMISDTGTSAPFEFSITGKTLFLFYNSDWFAKAEMCQEEKSMCETAITFYSQEEFQNLLKNYFHATPEMQKMLSTQQTKQKEMISKYLYNPGCATDKACQAILQELKLY